jgi:hypothetical protein
LKKEEARLNRPRYGGKEKDMSDQKEKDTPDQKETDVSDQKETDASDQKEKDISDDLIVEFSCPGVGKNSLAMCTKAGGMPVNSIVSINGTTDLQNIVQFERSGRVYEIRLKYSPGYYDYVVEVDAQGPRGGTGSGHLKFTDASNDTYNLSIYSSTRSVHTVRYNSKKPNITLINWSG